MAAKPSKREQELKAQLKEKDQYDSMLENLESSLENKEFLNPADTSVIAKPKKASRRSINPEDIEPVGAMNYYDVGAICSDQAEDLINYLVEFYLDGDILNDPYIKKRMDDDKSTLSELLLQMKTSEHAIVKLLERIDNGAMEARNFEVLSQLQKSKMEIVKHYEAVKLMIERNYKNLKVDYDRKHEEYIDTGNSTFLSNKAGGWNSLMSGLSANIDKGIKERAEEKAKEAIDTDFEDVDLNEDEEDFELVKKKPDIVLPKGLKFNDKY